MDAPKGLISVDIHNLAACYPQTLAVIAAQSKEHKFEALGYVLTILKNSPTQLVNKHITFCGKLLPFIEQGVQESKLDAQKTKEVMQSFVKAGVFVQFDPSVRVSQVQLGSRSDDSPAEKVSVALLPFMTSPFAQLLEHRLKQESDLEIGLSLPARQALKHFLEKFEMPAAPLKPSVLFELCRLENELHKAPNGPFCTFVSDLFDKGLGVEKVEKASIQIEDLSSDEDEKIEKKPPLHAKKKMIKSLFDIHTVQDVLDCYALVKLVYGGYDREESCLILHKLKKMLEAFESEEGLLALNQIAADLNSILDPIKHKKREIKELLEVAVRKYFARSKEEIAAHPDTKPIICCGYYDDQRAFISNFDWSMKIVANETLRVNALRSYSSYGDNDGIGLEAFKLMTAKSQGYFLRKTFYMLMITRENVALLEKIDEKEQLDGIDTVYTEVELEKWQEEKLQKIFPYLRTINIVNTIEESKASKRRLSKEKPPGDAFAHLTSYEEAFKPLCDKNDELNRERVELLKKLGPLAKTGLPLKDLVDFQWPLHHYYGKIDKVNAETINSFLKLLRQLTHFDAKLINEFRYACYSDFLSACAIGAYVKPGDAGDKKVMIGLESLPYMQSATPLGEVLRKSFDALILTEGKGERAIEGLRLARLLDQTPSDALLFNNVTHLYVSKKIAPAILAELFDLVPALKDKPIVFCEPLEASMDATLSQMDTKTPDSVRISF